MDLARCLWNCLESPIYGKRNDFVVEPYVNAFGQIIRPGDSVIAVSNSWKSTYVTPGTYRGLFRDKNGKIVSLSVLKNKTTWKYKEETNKFETSNVEYSACLPLKRVYRLSRGTES